MSKLDTRGRPYTEGPKITTICMSTPSKLNISLLCSFFNNITLHSTAGFVRVFPPPTQKRVSIHIATKGQEVVISTGQLFTESGGKKDAFGTNRLPFNSFLRRILYRQHTALSLLGGSTDASCVLIIIFHWLWTEAPASLV